MTSGRELDALVAEKVMGWALTSKDTRDLQGWPPPGNTTPIDVPEYSTDIAAAWEVVEKLDKYYFQVNREIKNMDSMEYTVVIPGIFNKERITVSANTAPHAICLAALKAVDV
jgi:hypothetical protein